MRLVTKWGETVNLDPLEAGCGRTHAKNIGLDEWMQDESEGGGVGINGEMLKG